MSEELNLDEIEFAENPEPRCPCVLLLDTSGSMSGAPIGIVTFDSQVNVVQDFVTADQYEPSSLSAGGATKMATAIAQGLDMVQDRKEHKRETVLQVGYCQ